MTQEQPDEQHLWVKCLVCGYEMTAELKDCTCEECGALDWSEPYK